MYKVPAPIYRLWNWERSFLGRNRVRGQTCSYFASDFKLMDLFSLLFRVTWVEVGRRLEILILDFIHTIGFDSLLDLLYCCLKKIQLFQNRKILSVVIFLRGFEFWFLKSNITKALLSCFCCCWLPSKQIILGLTFSFLFSWLCRRYSFDSSLYPMKIRYFSFWQNFLEWCLFQITAPVPKMC